MQDKSLSAKSVSVMPVLLLVFIHVIVTPLRDIFSIEPMLMIPYYLTGVLIGIFIYRKSNTVKDFEYRRSKVMKKMKNVYAAEEAGVWQTNAEIPSEISNQSRLSADVSQISMEAPEIELSDENKVEVSMLNESKSVIEATRRVSGESTYDDQEVQSTIGATRKASPMDRFLDFLGGIFGKGSAGVGREQQRITALKLASSAAPVRAEKPQAPIQYERNEVDIGPQSEYIDNYNQSATEQANESVSTSTAKDFSAFSPPKNTISSAQTLESMAMLPSSKSISPTSQNLPKSQHCRGCGYPIKPGDRFCDNCGLDVQ